MPISENSAFAQRFNMVMLPEERAMLQALARENGLNETDVLRQMIRRDYATAFGKRKPLELVAKYNSTEAREAKAKGRKR